jgi:hypothetical protein
MFSPETETAAPVLCCGVGCEGTACCAPAAPQIKTTKIALRTLMVATPMDYRDEDIIVHEGDCQDCQNCENRRNFRRLFAVGKRLNSPFSASAPLFLCVSKVFGLPATKKPGYAPGLLIER